MFKKVSVTKAKAQFSALVGEAAQGQIRVVIERRGQAIAAFVSMSDLERLGQGQPTSERPRGALALAGAWKDLTDEANDALISDIYRARPRNPLDNNASNY